ncbi:excisionase family DNA binding protein [Catenulispora sp. GP43]|uniref:helix-turn-helix domain-containing protein n=1 Tax=Catenulispora sp. GP43 TaxID=3156263 RepID=UPI00351532EE
MPNKATADAVEDRKALKVAEVARRYDLDKSTIYRQIKSGDLPAFRIGGSVRVPIWALADFEVTALNAAKIETKSDTATGEPAVTAVAA